MKKLYAPCKFPVIICFLILSMANTGISQNVGIGVTNPAFKLDIMGRIRVKTGTLNNVNTSSGIWFEDYRDGFNRFFFGMKDSIQAGFYSGTLGWDMFYNTKTGNMGLGILNPTFKLAMNGGLGFYSGVNDDFGGSISPDLNDIYISARKINSPNTPGNLVLQFTDPRSPTFIAGNVGIGIDSPFYKLALNGDQAIYNGSTFIGFLGNDGSDFLINARNGNLIQGTSAANLLLQFASGLGATSGRVAIGTDAPTGKLHVYGSAGELFRAGTTTQAIQMTADYIQFINSSAGKFFMQLSGNNLTLSNSSGNNTGILVLNGNAVTIGQITPANGYKLSVAGKAICEELKVQLAGSWPDYVFHKNYQLKSFDELRNYITENNHLPNIPAASELEKNGMEVGDMQRRMMEKIEELTLYVLQLEQQLKEVKQQLKKDRP